MDMTSSQPLRALAQCVSLVGGQRRNDSLSGDGYRELWAMRRLFAAVRLTLADADWDGGPAHEVAVLPKHHLVLLEAAANAADGYRAATRDGFPHAGSTVNDRGTCDAGFCPCRDGSAAPQPRLLSQVA